MATHNLLGEEGLLKWIIFWFPHLTHAHFHWVCKTFTPPSVAVNKLKLYITAELFFPQNCQVKMQLLDIH